MYGQRLLCGSGISFCCQSHLVPVLFRFWYMWPWMRKSVICKIRILSNAYIQILVSQLFCTGNLLNLEYIGRALVALLVYEIILANCVKSVNKECLNTSVWQNFYFTNDWFSHPRSHIFLHTLSFFKNVFIILVILIYKKYIIIYFSLIQ